MQLSLKNKLNTPTSIALLYMTFAVFATAANLGSQALVLQFQEIPEHFQLPAAIITGTGAGLITKFLLDKYFIFKSTSPLQNAQKEFLLYTITGVGTTLIFWGTEAAFHLLWNNPAAKYTGAGIGLAVGYMIKYRLDKVYVFQKSEPICNQ